MAAALDTVADYIFDVRTMLQDIIPPYRYDDQSLLVAFNVTLLEARRLRADLFVFNGATVPYFTAVDASTLALENPFRLAIVYGTAAQALARDQEDVQDARSTAFLRNFTDILIGLRPSGIGPGAGSPPERPQTAPAGGGGGLPQ